MFMNKLLILLFLLGPSVGFSQAKKSNAKKTSEVKKSKKSKKSKSSKVVSDKITADYWDLSIVLSLVLLIFKRRKTGSLHVRN